MIMHVSLTSLLELCVGYCSSTDDAMINKIRFT